jgi:hypothetical protein
MTKTVIFLMLAGLAVDPALAQKGGKVGSGCTNLTGHLTFAMMSWENSTFVDNQILPDGKGSYPATLFNCPGESGGIAATLGSGRTLTRDFSKILASPDSPPAWWAANPVQTGGGGFSFGYVVSGYNAATGYASPYPHASCWENGKNPNLEGCTFTTGAGSNFTASDKKTYSLRWRNPNADTISSNPQTDYDVTLDSLLNEVYPLALVQVEFFPAPSNRALDKWIIEPVADASGRFVSSIFISEKGSIQRKGYYDMNFQVTVTR